MKKNYLKIFPILLSLAFYAQVKGQAPTADFELCVRVITQYSSIKITDLSTDLPNQWEWDVYDSTTYASTQYYPSLMSGDLYSDPFGNGNDEFSQNPEFSFDIIGCYTVTLKATNAIGSDIKVKKCYIKVIAPEDFYLGYGTYGPKGDNHIYNDYGRISDDGGRDLNYGNNNSVNTKSYFKITPANGQNITLKLQQIKLADLNDSLCVYDDDTVNNSKILGIYTSANNGQMPTLNTTSSKMYICFRSNATGTDSGYAGYFYTTSGTPVNPNVNFSYSNATIGSPTTFRNEYLSVYRFTYDMRWTVDDTLQTSYLNADSMVYTFNNNSTYKVCMEAYNCDTSIKVCKNINAKAGIQTLQKNNFTVYPNPFNKNIYFESVSNVNVNAIHVYSIYGQEIEATMQKTDRGYVITCDQDLASGIYILRIESNDGQESVYKIRKD